MPFILPTAKDKSWSKVCLRCGKEFVAGCVVAKYCPDCREAHRAEARNERNQARRKDRKSRGECIFCGNQDERTLNGFTTCTMCTKKRKTYQAGTRQKRKANGLCSSCGKPTDHGYVNCEACRNMLKDMQRTRREKKLCTGCGKSDELTEAGKALCRECTVKQSVYDANRYDLRIRNRMCAACGEHLPSGWYFVYCPECIEISRTRQRTSARARKAAKDEGVQQGLH